MPFFFYFTVRLKESFFMCTQRKGLDISQGALAGIFKSYLIE
jgi:hypothetical protein